ncbi:MAG: hypothetical protein ACI841_001916, partial [Planctomycetota bacterium]
AADPRFANTQRPRRYLFATPLPSQNASLID